MTKSKCNMELRRQPEPSLLYKAVCNTHKWTSKPMILEKANQAATAHEQNPEVHNESAPR